MARPAAHAKTHNGFDPDRVQEFVDRINNLQGTIRSEHAAYMAKCKEIRGEIKGVFLEVKDAEIPLGPFRKVIKARVLAKKIEDIREELDEDDVDHYDNLHLALGGLVDLPLGQAAIEKAEKKKVEQKPKRGRGRPKKSADANGEAGDAVH